VSIVIATKDRYETLFDCLRSLLVNYGGDDAEIVVRDNSARPRSEDVAAEFGERRNVVYRHDANPVSQSENYERGVAMARGDFVTMIGDDDGVAGGLCQIADWMDRHRLDAFFPGFCVYLWPGVEGRLGAVNPDGQLSVPPASAPRLVDAEAQRRAVLAQGCTSLEGLPRLYYGLIRRSCLDEVRRRAGACFPGPSPDMANAYALSYTVGRMAVAELPVFIAGNSRKSNAGLGLRGHHVGEIPDLPFLPRDTAERWNRRIPFFWSGQTIWCQSAYAAASALGRAQEFEAANDYRALYARVLVFQPRYAGRAWRALRGSHPPKGAVALARESLAIAVVAGRLWGMRLLGFARRRLLARWAHERTGHQASGIGSIIDATHDVDRAARSLDLPGWLERCAPVAR
jgi:glycosyltransferase involved in cell wall biosynthesis